MPVKYEVTAAIREEGRDKPRYVRMGSVIDTRNGPMVKLDAIPVGWDGWAYLNEPKPKEDRAGGNRPQGPQRQSSADDFQDSSIPF